MKVALNASQRRYKPSPPFIKKIISEAINFSKIEKKAISDSGLNTEVRKKNKIYVCQWSSISKFFKI